MSKIRTHNSKGIESYDIELMVLIHVMLTHEVTSLRDGRARWWVVGGAHVHERALHGDMPSTWSAMATTTLMRASVIARARVSSIEAVERGARRRRECGAS